MPLAHGYGVVIGTLDHWVRDPINNFGQYYHENVFVSTPAGVYHCAIDVDTKMTNDGIEWRVVPLTALELKGVAALPNGWHPLASNATSGAIDNIRTTAFHDAGCLVAPFFLDPLFEALRRAFELYVNPAWSRGTSVDALNVLEPLLNGAQRLFVFGEPFTNGLGVHNIHQNQGDPQGSQWWSENGIWQDGTTIMRQADGTFLAFLTKFKTQAYTTDAAGHPS